MNPKAALAIFVKHIIGGINYAMVNVLYDTEMDWKEPNGKVPTFKKSIFVALISFISCWLVMAPFLYMSYRKYRASPEAKATGYANSPYSIKSAVLLILPSVFDYVAVTISLTGNKWILASLVVGIKALRIFLSTALSIKFLNRKYYAYHWLGIAMVVPGVICVGAANELNKTKVGGGHLDWYWPYVGMTCVVVAEFLRAAKAVYEEKMLQHVHLCPKFVAVVEGVFCTILALIGLFVFHAMPGEEGNTVGEKTAYGEGSMENIWNTLEWIRNSPRVQLWVIWLTLTTGFITFAGFLVIKYLSAVHNALWSELRVLIVWLTELCIGFAMPGEGTKWGNYSFLSLIGFGFIILCGLIFNKTYILPIPWLYSGEANHSVKEVAEPCTDNTIDYP